MDSIPFRLVNGPAEFQRTMENCLGNIRDKFVVPYLDDLLVYSKSFSEHVEHIRDILRLLRADGVKLKASKCQLFQNEVKNCQRGRIHNGFSNIESSICFKKNLSAQLVN